MQSIRLLCTLCVLVLLLAVAPLSARADVDWASLNATSMAAVDSAEFLTLSDDDFASVHWRACAGMQTSQLANLGKNGEACAGIPFNCLPALSFGTLQGMQPSCWYFIPANHVELSYERVPALPGNVIAMFSSAQWENLVFSGSLNGPVLNAFTADQLAHLPSRVCSGMTDSSLGRLEPWDHPTSTPPPCSGLPPTCVAVIPPTAMSAISPMCLSDLQSLALYGMTGAQAAVLKPLQLNRLTRDQTNQLSAAFCGALKPDSLVQLATSQQYQDTQAAVVGVTNFCMANLSILSCTSASHQMLLDFAAASDEVIKLSSLPADCVASISCDDFKSYMQSDQSPLYMPGVARALRINNGWDRLQVNCGGTAAGHSIDWNVPRIVLLVAGCLMALMLVIVVAIILYLKKCRQGRNTQAQDQLNARLVGPSQQSFV